MAYNVISFKKLPSGGQNFHENLKNHSSFEKGGGGLVWGYPKSGGKKCNSRLFQGGDEG